MYLPTHFSEQRIAVLHDTIKTNPLGTLISLQESGLQADHIPFTIVPGPGPHGTLHGHVARANPLCQEIDDNQEALIVFNGPQAYVSPSWYPSKNIHGKVVPTWNYVVVHAYGQLSLIHDTDWLLAHVTAMTAQQEARLQQPWQVSDIPDGFIDKMLTGIVGIEIVLTRLEGKWKLSQNRSAEDRAGVVAGLLDIDPQSALAELMSKMPS